MKGWGRRCVSRVEGACRRVSVCLEGGEGNWMAVCAEGGVRKGELCMWRVCVLERVLMLNVHALHIL